MADALPILAPLPEHWRASNERHIATLAVTFRSAARALVLSAWAHGLPVVIVQSRRTDEQQLALWRQGRETPGLIVTEAKTAYETPHGAGAAVDLAFLVDGALVASSALGGGSWSEAHPWAELGAVIEALGLGWGGRFPHPDKPHAQHANWRAMRSLT